MATPPTPLSTLRPGQVVNLLALVVAIKTDARGGRTVALANRAVPDGVRVELKHGAATWAVSFNDCVAITNVRVAEPWRKRRLAEGEATRLRCSTTRDSQLGVFTAEPADDGALRAAVAELFAFRALRARSAPAQPPDADAPSRIAGVWDGVAARHVEAFVVDPRAVAGSGAAPGMGLIWVCDGPEPADHALLRVGTSRGGDQLRVGTALRIQGAQRLRASSHSATTLVAKSAVAGNPSAAMVARFAPLENAARDWPRVAVAGLGTEAAVAYASARVSRLESATAHTLDLIASNGQVLRDCRYDAVPAVLDSIRAIAAQEWTSDNTVAWRWEIAVREGELVIVSFVPTE